METGGAHGVGWQRTRHTEGTSVYPPNKPTRVSGGDRSSSCVGEGIGSAGPALPGPLALYAPPPLPPAPTEGNPLPTDLHVPHRWVWSFLWPVWQFLVARGLGIEQMG